MAQIFRDHAPARAEIILADLLHLPGRQGGEPLPQDPRRRRQAALARPGHPKTRRARPVTPLFLAHPPLRFTDFSCSPTHRSLT